MIATILKALRSGGTEGEVTLKADRYGSLITTGGLPPYTELSRQGQGWSVMNTSALAALVVRPSTTANLTLYNGEPEGGKSYVLDRAFAFNLVSTAALGFWGMWLCVHKKMAAPTSDITAIKGHTGKANYGGKAVVDTGATVADDGWFPWGPYSEVEPTGVLPGGIACVELNGRLIIPPGCGFSTQVVASVTGNTFTTGMSWYEVQLDLE